jgi:nucleoside-diphosphate-sugar epimerase
MITRHRRLLDAAVESAIPYATPLRNCAICITGASGFLAASLVAFLSELNRAACLNLRLFANARRPLDQIALFQFLGISPQVTWTQAAVEEVTLPAAKDLIVVHAASYGSPRDYLREPIATYRANTQGLMNLFGQERRLRQFVYISSAEIYGQPPAASIPTPETFVGGLDTLSARSIYGESKRMAEVLGVCLGEQQGVPFTALRPWNVYGPGQRTNDGRVPMEFVRQALQDRAVSLSSNGTPTRAFCHVWDAMRQITATLGDTAKAGAFNIGNSTEEISVLALARRCAVTCGLPAEAVTFDPSAPHTGLQQCVPDVSAILTRTDSTRPFTSLHDGLATLVEWHNFLTRQ